MNKYTDKTGKTYKVNRFMELPRLDDGYFWEDISPIGAGCWHFVEKVQPPARDDRLFGYEPSVLLAKQYK